MVLDTGKTVVFIWYRHPPYREFLCWGITHFRKEISLQISKLSLSCSERNRLTARILACFLSRRISDKSSLEKDKEAIIEYALKLTNPAVDSIVPTVNSQQDCNSLIKCASNLYSQYGEESVDQESFFYSAQKEKNLLDMATTICEEHCPNRDQVAILGKIRKIASSLEKERKELEPGRLVGDDVTIKAMTHLLNKGELTIQRITCLGFVDGLMTSSRAESLNWSVRSNIKSEPALQNGNGYDVFVPNVDRWTEKICDKDFKQLRFTDKWKANKVQFFHPDEFSELQEALHNNAITIVLARISCALKSITFSDSTIVSKDSQCSLFLDRLYQQKMAPYAIGWSEVIFIRGKQIRKGSFSSPVTEEHEKSNPFLEACDAAYCEGEVPTLAVYVGEHCKIPFFEGREVPKAGIVLGCECLVQPSSGLPCQEQLAFTMTCPERSMACFLFSVHPFFFRGHIISSIPASESSCQPLGGTPDRHVPCHQSSMASNAGCCQAACQKTPVFSGFACQSRAKVGPAGKNFGKTLSGLSRVGPAGAKTGPTRAATGRSDAPSKRKEGGEEPRIFVKAKRRLTLPQVWFCLVINAFPL
jgi:hypothetical protein